jgi:microsomal dipeptidase-like Zn-dependent dipeptidase
VSTNLEPKSVPLLLTGYSGQIVGLQDATDLPHITTEMVRRGYTDEEITKIWGGNLLRVWREVERVASEVQSRDL